MAITTSAELQTAVANWLARADQTSRIPEYIALCEAMLRRDIKAAIDQETKTTSFSITGEYVNLPSDFQEVRSFSSSVAGERFTINFMPEAEMTRRFDGTPGVPLYYCNVASQFRFAPVPDATYTATLVYLVNFTALAAAGGSDNNFVLTKHPDAYLWGSLVCAMTEIHDDERAPMFKAAYDSTIASINSKSARSRWSANLQIRPG